MTRVPPNEGERDSSTSGAEMEREDVLQALRVSEQRYRSLFEALPLPTLSWKRVGEEFVCQEVNDAGSRFTGGRERQLLGHAASELWPDEPSLLADFERCWRECAAFRHVLLHTLRTTGERKWLAVTFAFAPPDLLVTQVEDLTERRRYEESLARSEREYRMLFEDASDGILVEDDDGAILDVNRRLCEMVGLTREELLGVRLQDLLTSESNGRPSGRRSPGGLRVGELLTTERRFDRVDGTVLDAELSIRRIAPGRVLSIARDVSERKRAETELRQLSAKLLQLQDEERRRIARELHDSTGQVLTGLALTLDALVRTADLDGPTRRALDKAKALAEQGTRDIRTLSYLLHPPMLEEAGLSAALEWLVEGFAERSGVTARFSMTQEDERLPHDVELALFRVVQEGLTNVHRHSGSPTAEVSMTVRIGEVVVEVVDHGRGIPPRDRARAMRGVGIAGMRERLRELGGRLDVESDAGGTTVRATVPLGGSER